ncbi:MAG: autotransporter outer membrane beta-barrel domain-containing protein, partial [Pseudomonadota bacterium]
MASTAQIFRNASVVGLAAAAATTFFPEPALAISTGCAATNLNGNGASLAAGGDFEVGESLFFVGVEFVTGSLLSATADVVPAFAGPLVGSGSFTIPADGAYNFSINNPNLINVSLICIGGITAALEAAQETASNVTSRAAINQTAGLVAGRVSGFTSGGRAPASRTGAPIAPGAGGTQTSAIAPDQGFLGLSSDRAGAAAADGLQGVGVWANASWTGIQDKSAVAAQSGNVFTGIAGIDKAYDNGLLLGTALSFGTASFESDLVDFETGETSVGINAYGAYAITDMISVDAFLGYSKAWGRSDRSNDTIEGDWDTHRYFAAGNASYFNSWDEISVFASTGFVWGQSFDSSYSESDGTIVGSRQSRLGSLKALVQPSYLVTLDSDQGLFLEPYVLGEASYDVFITKISGHNNDRDSYRLGAGLNLFAGDNISGNLEASTVVGREDYGSINVLATFRYGF